MNAIKILIVDDEIDFLETIVNRLKRRRFDVYGAKSGAEAIDLARHTDFELALLDVKLPDGMDGIEVLRELKKLQPATEVIMLTGHASLETSQEGIKLGAFDYLLKPVRFEDLLVKMAAALGKKREYTPPADPGALPQRH
jgi:DNA-binding response OmpR family regulator